MIKGSYDDIPFKEDLGDIINFIFEKEFIKMKEYYDSYLDKYI